MFVGIGRRYQAHLDDITKVLAHRLGQFAEDKTGGSRGKHKNQQPGGKRHIGIAEVANPHVKGSHCRNDE